MSNLFKAFNPPTKLIVNEYAFWNPLNPSSVKSPDWEMDSGSLFQVDYKGYTGKIDDKSPDVFSIIGTNSAIFRLNTKKKDFKSVTVSFDLENLGLRNTPTTPIVEWDGVHIFLRYQSQYSLYYASVLRRDGVMVIKKKVPGGSSNSGTYYNLSSYVSIPTPAKVSAKIEDMLDGSVKITILDGSKPLLVGIDKAVGGATIKQGAVGIRGDNCEFYFSNFNVDT